MKKLIFIALAVALLSTIPTSAFAVSESDWVAIRGLTSTGDTYTQSVSDTGTAGVAFINGYGLDGLDVVVQVGGLNDTNTGTFNLQTKLFTADTSTAYDLTISDSVAQGNNIYRLRKPTDAFTAESASANLFFLPEAVWYRVLVSELTGGGWFKVWIREINE